MYIFKLQNIDSSEEKNIGIRREEEVYMKL
jgi:hypothetical protein